MRNNCRQKTFRIVMYHTEMRMYSMCFCSHARLQCAFSVNE